MARIIALSGELGSGKSSVAARLESALGARVVSTGAAQRQIAQQRGISTLELNRLAESDPTIDEEIDSVFRSLAGSPEELVVDSRLAWHFLPLSFKVHLVVDPVVGARRILDRPGAAAEAYADLPQALAQMTQRVESERRRFVDLYGVDIFRLRNYDLVVDTTQAPPEEVAAGILDALGTAGARDGGVPAGPSLLLAPRRVYPGDTADPGTPAGDGAASARPLAVAYRRPRFSVLEGEERLRTALVAGARLVPAVLVVEHDEVAPDGVRRAPAGLPRREILDRWAARYGFRFSDDPADPGPGAESGPPGGA